MCPQLDRFPTLRFELHRHAHSFLRSGKLNHTGICGNAILSRAPDFVERLAGGLADQVPERNLETRNVARTLPVIAQRAGQLFDGERVPADELRLRRFEPTGFDGGPDARKSLITENFDDRAATDAVCRYGSRIPRRLHLSGFADRLQVDDADAGNLQPRRGE